MKEALARFRFWLLGWYLAVSTVTLLGFGGAAYWVFERRLLRQTDELLSEHLDGRGSAGDGVQLYAFDGSGGPLTPESVPQWLLPYAQATAQNGEVEATFTVDEDREGREEVEREEEVHRAGKA